MSNLSIHFSYPWLLLLLIPAFALALIPYFRLSKRYRRTRNRIISIVTHLCVMVLCVCVLGGIEFRYVKKNSENEIILLVDVSDTEERAADRRDEFVKTVLSDGKYDGYKIGVVTFGFTQTYAVPLTYDVKNIYEEYLNAELPDTSATNLEAALKYAQTLFTHPETSKVVVISDGKETDGNAFSAIRALSAQGTTVDTAYISGTYEGEDIQITGIVLPETHIKANQSCVITVQLKSRQESKNVRVILKDNGTAVTVDEESFVSADLGVGANEVSFTHQFAEAGLHAITAEVTYIDDIPENGEYTTYTYLQDFNKVLLIEQKSEESEALTKLLVANDYSVDRLNLSSVSDDGLKTTNGVDLTSVSDLRRFDQVILNNISAADLAKFDGFTETLYSYVNDYGGGLLTLGGDDADGNAHAYNRSDLRGTKLQEMLPVEAINYTPPVGLVVCIDNSGSMTDIYPTAQEGLRSCYNALSERDYIGIVSLDSTYSVLLPLTSTTQQSEILSAIEKDQQGGSTDFYSAINRAGEMLQSNNQVEKRHIVILSDGEYNGDNDNEDNLKGLATELYARGISISVILVGTASSTTVANMEAITKPSGGRVLEAKETTLVDTMRNELGAKQLEESEEEAFSPIVKSSASTDAIFSGVKYGITGSSASGVTDVKDKFRLSVQLGGFYGVKKKNGAETLLTGNYDVIPLYARWKFGAGTVGSFMCDLTGLPKADGSASWSADFLDDENAQTLLLNIVGNLMPLEDISPAAFDYQLTEKNYTNTLSVYAKPVDGEIVEATIVSESDGTSVSLNEASSDGDIYVTTALNKANQYSRCEFIVKKAGVYKIVLTKKNADGEEIAYQTVEIYKTFAYSAEYDLYPTEEDGEAYLTRLAASGNGKAIKDLEDPTEIFESFVTGVSRTYDPRYLFAIVSMVLLLIDIAVRKFKFKWIHEIIRDKKREKEEKAANKA